MMPVRSVKRCIPTAAIQQELLLYGIQFCCASNAAIKNGKVATKKSPFFLKKFNNIVISPKCTEFSDK